MNELIEKTINPPGIQKKNRRSIFKTISDIFGKVRADALKAFNAHFPYLCDETKLEEHGAALLIPHLLDDTTKEYRDRVSTASFFLMRAGERAYIIEQLTAHFGDRYIVSDKFLDVFVKVRDLADSDRHWLLQFLDELINPNVRLSVAEWFKFIDQVVIQDILTIKSEMRLHDTFDSSGAKLNGRVKLDGRTLNPTVQVRPKLDGRWQLSGAISLSGAALTFPAFGYPRLPVKLSKGIIDSLNLKTKFGLRSGFGHINDRLNMELHTGMQSVVSMSDELAVAANMNLGDSFKMRVRKLDGSLQLNGRKKIGSGVIDKNTFTIATGHAEQYIARQKLNGAGKINGFENLSGFGRMNDRFRMRIRYSRHLDGRYQLDGSTKLNSGILIPA